MTTRHLLTLRIVNTPLAVARLHGVLRARRVGFVASTASTDDPGVLAVTIVTEASGSTAERMAQYCRRVVDVSEVAWASEQECVVQESVLIEVSVDHARLSSLLVSHPEMRVVATHASSTTIALAGTPADVAGAIAALEPSEINRLLRNAPIALIPISNPVAPAKPEELI